MPEKEREYTNSASQLWVYTKTWKSLTDASFSLRDSNLIGLRCALDMGILKTLYVILMNSQVENTLVEKPNIYIYISSLMERKVILSFGHCKHILLRYIIKLLLVPLNSVCSRKYGDNRNDF